MVVLARAALSEEGCDADSWIHDMFDDKAGVLARMYRVPLGIMLIFFHFLEVTNLV